MFKVSEENYLLQSRDHTTKLFKTMFSDSSAAFTFLFSEAEIKRDDASLAQSFWFLEECSFVICLWVSLVECWKRDWNPGPLNFQSLLHILHGKVVPSTFFRPLANLITISINSGQSSILGSINCPTNWPYLTL